jgi:hypothetical protein
MVAELEELTVELCICFIIDSFISDIRCENAARESALVDPEAVLVPDVERADDELDDVAPDVPASALPGAARAMAPRAARPNVASAAVLAMRFLII